MIPARASSRHAETDLQRLLEYATNHPFLAAAAALMALVVLAYELRSRAQSAASVAPADAVRLVNGGAVLVDVRSPADFKAGHIGGARNVPGSDIVGGAKALEKHREKTLVMCCETGATSASAARELARQGFKNVVNLRGGLAAWRQDNLPVVRD